MARSACRVQFGRFDGHVSVLVDRFGSAEIQYGPPFVVRDERPPHLKHAPGQFVRRGLHSMPEIGPSPAPGFEFHQRRSKGGQHARIIQRNLRSEGRHTLVAAIDRRSRVLGMLMVDHGPWNSQVSAMAIHHNAVTPRESVWDSRRCAAVTLGLFRVHDRPISIPSTRERRYNSAYNGIPP